ncbi:MAG: cold shock domain-containing protein [Anaerolineae bacterium]|jgi:CspA family cold shock protein
MPYRDTWATCEQCGKQFIFTVEEQRRLDSLGFEVEPTLCPECQADRKPGRELGREPESGEQLGIVKWYEPRKRYGFITSRSGDDIFFHRNAIVKGEEGGFTEGVKVAFRITESDKGPEAADVALLESE